MATQSNTYNDYSVAATDEYPLISNFSHWHKPQIGDTLWDVNPMETDTGEFMKMGLMKRVKGEEMIHHEARSRFDVPKVNSSATQALVYGTASTGNNDPAAFDSLDYIQLATESHSPSGAGATQYTKSYPRVGQHIMFSNGSEWRIKGKRTTGYAGAHRLYLQKVQSAMASLATTITNVGGTYGGNSFIVFTTSHGEQTLGQTEGLVPTSKTYTSYLQTFSDFYKVTDWEMQNETYPLKWKGKTINFTYHKGINDTEIRWGKMIDNGLFLQNKDEGTLTHLDPETGEDEVVTTTQGYVQNLELNAQPLYFDTTPTMGLFDQIGRLRRKLQQGKNCMKFVGYEYRTLVEGIITTLGINGGTTYDRMDADLNVSKIRKGGAIYNIKDLDILNDPKFGGAPGFKFPYYFIIAPMLKEKDSKNGQMLDHFNVMYKMPEGEGTRGHYKIWQTGAFANRATDARTNRRIHLYCRMGTQTVGASKAILGKPVTLS